jgi:hypothetical protein
MKIENKIARICWNSKGWRYPSGKKGKSTLNKSHENNTGFGYEEWLFDKYKQIDGYHYTFLQPIHTKNHIHDNKIYNVYLYAINSDNHKRYFIGTINNLECITKEQSTEIYKEYKSKGWLETMKIELQEVGADFKKFRDSEANIFFNIRFKFIDAKINDDPIEIAKKDTNINSDHYKLLSQNKDFILELDDEYDDYQKKYKTGKTKYRTFDGECEYTLRHNEMQNEIYDFLEKNKKEYDYKYIRKEKNRVDIKAKTNKDAWHYFEIKTDKPKESIRQALGQIIEYAYYPDVEKAEKLIIVADEEPNDDIIKYIKHIRNKFNLPITYRYFDYLKKELSADYPQIDT